jgi:5'-nucleotidase
VSLYLRSDVPTNFAKSAKIGGDVVEQIWKAGIKPGQIVSVNIPALQADEHPTGVRVVRQCTRPWADTYEKRTDPRGREYFWNSSVFTLGDTEDDTDVAALRDKYVTITPLQFDLTHHLMMREWKDRDWRL